MTDKKRENILGRKLEFKKKKKLKKQQNLRRGCDAIQSVTGHQKKKKDRVRRKEGGAASSILTFPEPVQCASLKRRGGW